MKFQVAAAALVVLASPALAQSPSCASSVTSQLTQGVPCSTLDLKCFCQSPVFAKNIVEQVPKVCNAADTATVKATFATFCKSLGVTINYPSS